MSINKKQLGPHIGSVFRTGWQRNTFSYELSFLLLFWARGTPAVFEYSFCMRRFDLFDLLLQKHPFNFQQKMHGSRAMMGQGHFPRGGDEER